MHTDQELPEARQAAPALTTAPGPAVAAIAPAVILAIGMVAAVNLVIPQLRASALRPSVSGTAWIVDSYTLVFACLLIPAGALGDRFGRKRGMLIGLALFAAGSAVAALAPDVAVLMCGRALSGVGAALVLPATLAVSLARVPPAGRPRVVALWSGLTGIGGVVGNLGGGLADEYGGWRALFWAGVPIALAAAALIAVRVPSQTPHRDRVDGGGTVLLTAGSAALLYGIIDGPVAGWGSVRVLGALGLAVVLLGVFAWYETRREHPMLDPRLFRLTGVRVGAIGIFAQFFALFGLFYINAQYLQDVKGYGPLLTAVAILPLAAVMAYVSGRSPRVAARIGGRATAAGGLACVAAALALMSLATGATPYALYGALLALVGVGCGLALAPLSGMIVHALPPSHAGVASGLNSTTRELGSALGVAVFSTFLASHRAAFTAGMGEGLRVGAAFLLLATVVVALQYPAYIPAKRLFLQCVQQRCARRPPGCRGAASAPRSGKPSRGEIRRLPGGPRGRGRRHAGHHLRLHDGGPQGRGLLRCLR